jgi:hypothetical protein
LNQLAERRRHERLLGCFGQLLELFVIRTPLLHVALTQPLLVSGRDGRRDFEENAAPSVE